MSAPTFLRGCGGVVVVFRGGVWLLCGELLLIIVDGQVWSPILETK